MAANDSYIRRAPSSGDQRYCVQISALTLTGSEALALTGLQALALLPYPTLVAASLRAASTSVNPPIRRTG